MNKLAISAAIIFLFFTSVCTGIHIPSPLQSQFYTICSFYGTMALYGGIVGLFISKIWGGWKSVIGRSIIFFSLGLLAQDFGQLAYNLYIDIFHIPVPYPSLGDVGYFGSIFLYAYATWLLAKAAGAKISLKQIKYKLTAIAIPLVMVSVSYYLFLMGYQTEGLQPFAVLLDFGYPLGQAVYVSIAFIAYILSRKHLGGTMKKAVLLVLFTLVVQYAADFTFLFQTIQGTWIAGGINDLMYLFAYFIMTIALIRFKVKADQLKK